MHYKRILLFLPNTHRNTHIGTHIGTPNRNTHRNTLIALQEDVALFAQHFVVPAREREGGGGFAIIYGAALVSIDACKERACFGLSDYPACRTAEHKPAHRQHELVLIDARRLTMLFRVKMPENFSDGNVIAIATNL